MAFANSVQRVTISGTSFGGAEIWSTGFYVGIPGADAGVPTQAFADNVRTAWTALFTNTNMGIHSNWKTNQIKVAELGADGKTFLNTVIYAPYGTPIAGASNGSCFPPQIALATTLVADGQRGLAAKGRMYLPGVSLAVGANGQIDVGSVTGMVAKMKTFLDAVNTAAGAGTYVVLASEGRKIKGTDGKYTPVPGTAVTQKVTSVRIGSVYDTQRRRRNALVEAYQSQGLA